ncbi:S-layer homology domain-containing protein [Cohnella sp. WQ 127256]|uniref:S-layer homology domain-containing protein n=1 Tax=Cohnella sp. WQ 127256 TaxID=2938790 RepID=UPI002117A2E0|nr:S-layer homology domain-containing protein [Cohnella sp. WQ 127256]
MRGTKSLRKSLLVFLCFALIVSWGSMFSPSKASATSTDYTPQVVETLISGPGVKEVVYKDGERIKDEVDDEESEFFDLPFAFTFYEQAYDKVSVSSNGYLTFGNNSRIAPFNDDLYVTKKSKILYTTIGTAPKRKFVVQYTNMAFYSTRYSPLDPMGTFQVILNEEDNSIQFQYPNLIGFIGDRTFGTNASIKIMSSNQSVVYSIYKKSITEKQAIRFTPGGPAGYELVSNIGNEYAPYDKRVVYEPILLSADAFPGSSVAVSPADGSYTASNHTFQWSSAIGANSYRLLIAEDANFRKIVQDKSGIGQTSFDIKGLNSGTTYYWKVAAVNDAGYFTFSNTYRFNVPFETVFPLNQSVETLIQGEEINFDDGNAKLSLPFEVNIYNSHYSEIEIRNDGYLEFNNDDYESVIELSLDYDSDSKVLYATLGEAPNRKIVLQYTNMYLDDESFGTFQVVYYESDKSIQIQYPFLLPSSNGYPVSEIELWGESNNEDEYWQSSYLGGVAEKQAIRFSPNGPTSYVVTRNADYDPVLLVPADLPAPLTLVSPADGSNSSNEVEFKWNNSTGEGNTSGETSYGLFLATDSSFSPDSRVDMGLDEPITDTSYTKSGLEEGLVYYWKVIAFNNKGYTFSNTYRFKVLFSNQSTTVATDDINSITSMTATAGGTVVTSGGSPVLERGIVYSKNANPSYSDTKVAAEEGTAFTVGLVGLQSNTTYHARAYAISEGQVFYGQDVTFTTLASPASLSALSISGITLDQSVSGTVYSYTARVPNTVSSTAVTATVQDAVYRSVTANVYNNSNTLVFGPIDLASGVMSSEIPLNVGTNKIEIVVLALDDSGTTYSVDVTRAAAPTPPSVGGGGGAPSVVKSKDGKLTLPVGKAGEVSLDKDIEITIPAFASKKQLELTIEKVLSTQGLLGNKEILASSVFEILKNFTENFDKSVTITISFDPAKLKSGQTVAIFYYDEVKKTWVKVEGGKISKDRISADVNHFTKFAALVVNEKTGLPVLEQSTGTTTDPVTEVKFSDIAKHWAEASIKQAVYSGIIKGYTDGTFKPNATVTRAEFAVMLMNALKPQGNGADLKFTDNAKIGTWAQKAVAQAVQANIIKGNQDGSFRPNAEVTRAEMAVMIANALGQPIEANATTSFADDKGIPAWAKGSVAIVKQAGIVQGNSDNKYAPQSNATRAEAVTVLLKMLAYQNK